MAELDLATVRKQMEMLYEAGHKLSEHLQRIKLDPDILCWIFYDQGPQLALVSSLVDRIGPKEMYDALFQAQDRGLLSQDLDVWLITIYSPKSEIGIELRNHLSVIGKSGFISTPIRPQDYPVDDAGFHIGLTDPLFIPGKGIYRVRGAQFSATQDINRWKMVQREIAQAA